MRCQVAVFSLGSTIFFVLDTGKMRQLREKLGLTQEQAAERAGLPSRARWNDIESGRKINITLGTLDAIAKALHVHGADLLKK